MDPAQCTPGRPLKRPPPPQSKLWLSTAEVKLRLAATKVKLRRPPLKLVTTTLTSKEAWANMPTDDEEDDEHEKGEVAPCLVRV